jgi:type V secretory pathway adhesin AidA
MSTRTNTILAISTLLATLTACSGDDQAGAPSTQQSGSDTPASTPSQPPSPAPSPTPTPTPTPKPTPVVPKAADATNFKACSDARCEVLVKTGSRVPVKKSVLGFSTLVVSRVSAGSVDFGGSSSCCSVSAGGQQAGNTFRMNNLKVVTVAVTGKTAILRLSPA